MALAWQNLQLHPSIQSLLYPARLQPLSDIRALGALAGGSGEPVGPPAPEHPRRFWDCAVLGAGQAG
jgi:hypothetical protein